MKSQSQGMFFWAVVWVTSAMVVAGCNEESTGASRTQSSSAGSISFSTSAMTATQTTDVPSTVNVPVSRLGRAIGTVGASYSTSDSTATAGQDYVGSSGTITWADGDTKDKSIPITLGTEPFCGTRTFLLSLSKPFGGATLGTASIPFNVLGTLVSPPGILDFPATTVSAYQGAGFAIVPVRRELGIGGAVELSFSTADDGTADGAVAGQEYFSAGGALHWEPCDATNKNVLVPLNAAAPFVGTRTFNVKLDSPSGGASLGTNQTAKVNLTGLWIPPATALSIDFSNWKLMLPIDAYGGTGGKDGIEFPSIEIQSAELLSGFVDAYFYADDSGHLIMTAPSNGAATTPGDGYDHTRSELRELYTGPNAVKNDWTNAIGGTMTATMSVKSVAANSEVATIGQIHGQDHTFMLLLYRKTKKDVVVDIYASNAAVSTHLRTPILTGVELGDNISYSIRYINDTLTTTAKNLTKKSDEQTVISPIDPSWVGALVYFKIGAYHSVPNVGNADGDQTQVSISALSVSH